MNKETGSISSISLKDMSRFGRFFLLEFTKELIRNSGDVKVLELEEPEEKWAEEFVEELKKPEEKWAEEFVEELEEPLPRIPQQQMFFQPRIMGSRKQKPQQRTRTHLRTIDMSKELEKPLPRIMDIEELERPFPKEIPQSFNGPLRMLRIPEPKLPPRLQYLRPRPTNIQLNLGILNPLIQDPTVDSIECYGSDKPIITRGRMGARKTNIILDYVEIDTTIRRFAESAKIPIHEGVMKIARGRLILSAIVSTTISSKFIIKKVRFNPLPPSLPQPGFSLTRQF